MNVLIGDPDRFAIESEITKAYERPSFRGLGYFVIYLGSRCFGVRDPEATLLACSFDEVGRRLDRRGSHTAYISQAPANEVAKAVTLAFYGDERPEESYWGRSRREFKEALNSSSVIWAPDGDEAFDDMSVVLQFDLGDRVRLVGYTLTGTVGFVPESLRDITLEAAEFYGLLSQWRDSFEGEWIAAPKADAGTPSESSARRP